MNKTRLCALAFTCLLSTAAFAQSTGSSSGSVPAAPSAPQPGVGAGTGTTNPRPVTTPGSGENKAPTRENSGVGDLPRDTGGTKDGASGDGSG
jgi:hypothetical protein